MLIIFAETKTVDPRIQICRKDNLTDMVFLQDVLKLQNIYLRICVYSMSV